MAGLLNRDFPPGLLQEYVDLPWPLTCGRGGERRQRGLVFARERQRRVGGKRNHLADRDADAFGRQLLRQSGASDEGDVDELGVQPDAAGEADEG